MSWFKIDDGFHNHPKILGVGNAAAGLFVRFGSYSSQQLTDGFVPAEIARIYGNKREISTLLEAGLIAPAAGGYQIPDFLDYNPSAEKVREKRAKVAAKVADWRARQTDSNPVSNHVTDRDVTGLVTTSVTLPPTRPDPTRPEYPLHPQDEVTRDVPEPVDIEGWTKRRRLS